MQNLSSPINLFKTDCLTLLGQLDDQSVDAIVTDPPYFKVKTDSWDHQWSNENTFFEWLDTVAQELARVLKPNGSIYLFCSSHLQHQTETIISKHFKMLNHILWVKKSGKHMGCHPPSLRRYFPQTESILFAEHKKAIKPERYVCDDVLTYLQTQWKAAGFKYSDAEKIAGSTARHYFSRSQWHMPSKEKYLKLQHKAGREFLYLSYEELISLKSSKQRDKSQLRCFTPPLKADLVNRPHTNIWNFAPVQFYQGKHSCEKPQALLEHILLTSTCENDLVLDVFAGSCSTAKVCLKLKRKFIGCDLDDQYFESVTEATPS